MNKVFIATVRQNDWDAEDYILGVFSTKEKAEAAIVEDLRLLGEDVLNLEIYEKMNEEDPAWFWNITEWIVDN